MLRETVLAAAAMLGDGADAAVKSEGGSLLDAAIGRLTGQPDALSGAMKADEDPLYADAGTKRVAADVEADGSTKRVKKEGAAPGMLRAHPSPLHDGLGPLACVAPDDDSQQNYLDMQPKFYGVESGRTEGSARPPKSHERAPCDRANACRL